MTQTNTIHAYIIKGMNLYKMCNLLYNIIKKEKSYSICAHLKAMHQYFSNE